MEKGKKTLKMPLNTELFGEKGKEKSVERLCGTGDGGAANAAVSLAETWIKNTNSKRMSESAGKRINEGVGGQVRKSESPVKSRLSGFEKVPLITI